MSVWDLTSMVRSHFSPLPHLISVLRKVSGVPAAFFAELMRELLQPAGVVGGDDDDENVRCHRYDRHRRHHSRHQQLFSRVVAPARLTHARCVNQNQNCCSLSCCTHHRGPGTVAAMTEVFPTTARRDSWQVLSCCSHQRGIPGVSHDGSQRLSASRLQR